MVLVSWMHSYLHSRSVSYTGDLQLLCNSVKPKQLVACDHLESSVVTMSANRDSKQKCCLGLLYYSQALQAEGQKPVRCGTAVHSTTV